MPLQHFGHVIQVIIKFVIEVVKELNIIKLSKKNAVNVTEIAQFFTVCPGAAFARLLT